MYLLVPSNSKDLMEAALWFKHPIARKLLEEKGVEFGFELKGEPETITEAPDLYWGYHMPVNFAEKYHYHPENRQELLDGLKHIVKLKPQYINMHGIKLWWKPSRGKYVKRYESRNSALEYFEILNETIELVKKVKEIFPQLTFENTTLTDYYRPGSEVIPMTALQTSIGAVLDQMYIKEQTGVELLFDIEHSIVSLNFLNRKKNYADLKQDKIDLTAEEKKISNIFGYKIKKDFIPYAEPKLKFEEIVAKVQAKRYHITGTTQDVIIGVKDLSHAPIRINDLTFRKNLRTILKQDPESILIETAKKSDYKCFSYLRENETELSFYNLCKILLEEL